MIRIALLACLLAISTNPLTLAQSRGGDILMPQQLLPTPVRSSPPINPSAVTIARLHYGGGGDWYWGSSALPNLLKFIRNNSNLPVDTVEKVVQIMDDNLFRYPFLFATGHGLMKFSDDERERLRTYLSHGGFLFINDSYGMDKNLRVELARLFPERELTEIPFEHEIYHSYYDFPGGPPKIHEHDKKTAQGFGIIIDGRVVLYYLYESDIGDGWEDPQVHNDPPEKREAALKMGLNLLAYALSH
nr:DUF4159 domain-containing protein [candidate division Zixibacteria bacterium]